MRLPRAIAVLALALLTALPTVALVPQVVPGPAADILVGLPPGQPKALDCAGAATLALPRGLGDAALAGTTFAEVVLTGVSGPVASGDAVLAVLDGTMPAHLLVRLSEKTQEIVVRCAPGAAATLRLRDLPVVETLDLPARVIGATFTRPSLSALGMDNLLEVYVVSPAPRDVLVVVQSEGTPQPSTLQALGEDVNASAMAWQRSLASLQADPEAPARLQGMLVRLALVCGPMPPADPLGAPGWGFDLLERRPAACAGAGMADLLARYDVPLAAARDLATRLAADDRCTSQATMGALLTGDEPWQRPVPCLALLAEWLDDALRREGLPGPSNQSANALRALGVQDAFAEASVAGLLGLPPLLGGPCGDRLQLLDPLASLDNRTMPSRALECFELLAAGLRPMRYAWKHDDVIRRFGSVDYGAAAIRVHTSVATEGKLTLATQGTAAVDLTISLGAPPPPANVQAALAPVRDVAAALGVELPPVPLPVQPVEDVPLDGSVGEAAAAVASDLAEPTVATVDALLAALEPAACEVSLQGPASEGCLPLLQSATLPPVAIPSPAVGGMDTFWEGALATQPPRGPPATYGPSAGEAMAMFRDLGPVPRAPPLDVAGGGQGDGGDGGGLTGLVVGGAAHASATVFVPHRAHVAWASPETLLPGVDVVEPPASPVGGFLEERLEDAQRTLGPAVPSLDPDLKVPAEVLLDGAAFAVRYEGGVARLERVAPAHRLVSLRDGGLDWDRDGVPNARELALAARVSVLDERGFVAVTAAMDPFNPDSDEDGMPDGWELLQCDDGTIPTPLCEEGLRPWEPDGAADADGDLLPNLQEYARSAAVWAGTACWETRRWACLADAAEARLEAEDPCLLPPLLLAWSPDARSRDGDCDAFHDGWELLHGGDALDAAAPDGAADPDGDALATGAEFRFYARAIGAFLRAEPGATFAQAVAAVHAGSNASRLDPGRADTDADGLPDGYEAERGLWPEDTVNEPPLDRERLPRRLLPLVPDAAADPDGDGLPTLEEFQWSLLRLHGERPALGLPQLLDALTQEGLDPFDPDTDGDGFGDGAEHAATGVPTPQDPLGCLDPLVRSWDCDGDGLDDRIELVVAGREAILTPEGAAWGRRAYACVLAPAQVAAGAVWDWTAPDSDGDGLPDGYECWYGLDPTAPADAGEDQDADGLTSGTEWAWSLALNPSERRNASFFDPANGGLGRTLVPTSAASHRAPDNDQDEMPDAYELGAGTDPFVRDFPHDPDGDGLRTSEEYHREDDLGRSVRGRFATDLAAGWRDEELLQAVAGYRLSPTLEDSDGDSMPDGWEALFGLDPFLAGDADRDADGDGLSNAAEYAFGAARYAADLPTRGTAWLLDPTHTLNATGTDSDHDGMPDRFETENLEAQGCRPQDTYSTGSPDGRWPHCFDPLDPDDAHDDFDGDGLSNLDEALAWEVVAVVRKVDGAGAPTTEVRSWKAAPDPLRWDTSGDGLSDWEKAPRVLPGCPLPRGLDPALVDTDDDGISDYAEVWQWTAVQGLPRDIDGDCYPNAADQDSDGDSLRLGDAIVVDLSDGRELDLKLTDPTRTDSDGDLMRDGLEMFHWGAVDRNPAGADTDYDADGAYPLRDWDSDGDDIPDGYEFHFALEPWQWRGPGHDTDRDDLADLCEYRITVQGNVTGICPEVLGPGTDTHGEQHFLAVTDQCVDAADEDCDHDGIHDGYEYQHKDLGWGCNPGVWTNHAIGGGMDLCLEHYIETISAEQAALYRAAIEASADKPRIRSVLFLPTASVEPSSVACFYHRVCRARYHPGAENQVTVVVEVEDRDCDLFFVRVQLGNYVNELRPGTHGEAPDCSEAQAGEPKTYVLRGGVALKRETRLSLAIRVQDNAGHVTLGHFENKEIAGTGYAWLDALNRVTDTAMGEQSQAFGRNLLQVVGTQLRDLKEKAEAPPTANDQAWARSLVGEGTAKYLQHIAWFGSSEFEAAVDDCEDPDALADPSHAIGCSPLITGHLQNATGARVKHIAGVAAMRDFARPAAEGLNLGLTALFEGGMGQRAALDVFAETVGSALGVDATGGRSKLTVWDSVVPQLLAPDAPQSGCGASQAAVATVRSAVPVSDQTSPDVPDLDAMLRYGVLAKAFAAQVPVWEAGWPKWDRECLRATLHDVFDGGADLGLAVVAGLQMFDLIAGLGGLSGRGSRILAGANIATSAVALGWTVAELAITKHAPGWKETTVFKSTCALLYGAAAVATLILGFGTPLAMLSAGFSMIAAIQCLEGTPVDLGGSPAGALYGPDGQFRNLHHIVGYRVGTYPDTEASSRADGATPDKRVLLQVVVGPAPAFSVDHDVPCKDKNMNVHGYATSVRVERLVGDAWQYETTLRLRHERRWVDGGWTYYHGADAWSESGDAWTVYASGGVNAREDAWLQTDVTSSGYGLRPGAVEATYSGPASPGLRRVTILRVPIMEVAAAVDLPSVGKAAGTRFEYPLENTIYAPVSEGSFPDVFTPSRAPGRDPAVRPRQMLPPTLAEESWFRQFSDIRAACRHPPVAEVVVFRGIGADAQAHGVVLQRGSIVDEASGAPGLTRTLHATGLRLGAGYRYFWDLGGNSQQAYVTEDPAARIRHSYKATGDYDVVVTVTNDRLEPVQQVHGRVHAQDIPTTIRWEPRREGDTFRLSAAVSDADECLDLLLTIAGQPRAEQPCDAGAFGTDWAFDLETPAAGLASETKVRLEVRREGTLRLKREVVVSPPPRPDLGAGAANGRFHEGYPQIDYFQYPVATEARPVETLQFHLWTLGSSRFEVEGPAAIANDGLHATSNVAGFAYEGSTWDLAVSSNYGGGCYSLWSSQQEPGVCKPTYKCFYIWGLCIPLPEGGQRKQVYAEGFEGDLAGIATSDDAGPAKWATTRMAASAGQRSMYMGRPVFTFQNEAAAVPERDELRIRVDLAGKDVERTRPLQLKYHEVARVAANEPAAAREVTAVCTGKDSEGKPVEWVAKRMGFGGDVDKWTERRIDFDCLNSGVESELGAELRFRWSTDRTPAVAMCIAWPFGSICPLVRGWFLDEVQVWGK